MAAELVPLPPQEAIAALLSRGRQLEASFDWRDVYAEIHAAQFTVARSAGFDILQDMWDALLRALQEGETFETFARHLRPTLIDKGWWGKALVEDPDTGVERVVRLGSTRRLRTIFETNMRVSYASGHWANFERNRRGRPYLRYVAILDDRTRPSHAARHNVCLPIDHPWWDLWAPPCGWGCRCTLQSLSERDVERLRGELIFDPPPDTYRDYVNRRTGEVRRVPDGIDPGWDYNPGKAGFAEIRRRLEERGAPTFDLPQG